MSATKITRVHTQVRNLDLIKPYTIAYRTVDSIENVFIYIETEGGLFGVGAGSPSEFISGETLDACITSLEHAASILHGEDIRQISHLSRVLEKELPNSPAARAAADIALHDLLSKHMNLPLVEMLGRVHYSMPTSITIGIKSLPESVDEALEYCARGFKCLKIKIGKSVDEDIRLAKRIRETVGSHIRMRVDANQAYAPIELKTFIDQTAELDLELIEQPFSQEYVQEMFFEVPDHVRRFCAADESLHTPLHALNLAQHPQSFGIFTIKLMKCGGIGPAMLISNIAHLAGIELMWGCQDESLISITAALHAAFASPATSYLDLDGSLDLARDLAVGGFILENGNMRLTDQPGLGVNLIESI